MYNVGEFTLTNCISKLKYKLKYKKRSDIRFSNVQS